MSPLLAAITVSLIGACVGSFAVTAGLRIARGERALSGRSRCDGCGARLSYLRTAPVVSYVHARGVCASCGARIPLVHLVVELASAATPLAALALAPAPRSFLVAALGIALVAAIGFAMGLGT